MQYQVDLTDQTPENGQKPLFGPFGSFKNAFLCLLNDPPWPGSVADCWKTFSSIKICNIKSIQQPNLQKMAKNLLFGTLDHSKIHFPDFSMILHDLAVLPIVGKHLVLSKMQHQVDPTTQYPENGQKPPFWHFGSFKNAFLRLLNDPAWAISWPNC